MIDVVYLAYFNEKLGYGINIVEEFLDTYKRHPAGAEHNLVIIVKNCNDKMVYEKFQNLAKENNAKIIDLPDDGFDMGAFIRAAKELESEYVFFLGSNIKIISDNWLLKFKKTFDADNNIKLAGPMGSWEKGISEVYPNPHIRTCAFMIERELFVEYANSQPFPQTKKDTWQMEHCENSISNYVLKKGYKMVVVNSDGEFFLPEAWDSSHTHMSPLEESKLIMEDKWTQKYRDADEATKIRTEMNIWGRNITKFPKNLITELSSKLNIFIPHYDFTPIFSSNIFHPILYGPINNNLETQAFQDCTGENISTKYPYYGELTTYFWVLKNFLEKTEEKYVGFCQCSKTSDFGTKLLNLTNTQEFDVILPEKTILPCQIIEQYKMVYSHSDIDLFNSSVLEILPDYKEAIIKAMQSNSMYMIGNFVMKKEFLKEFLQWFFDVLFILENKINLKTFVKCKDMAGSVFNSERLLNIWLTHNEDRLKIKTI